MKGATELAKERVFPPTTVYADDTQSVRIRKKGISVLYNMQILSIQNKSTLCYIYNIYYIW